MIRSTKLMSMLDTALPIRHFSQTLANNSTWYRYLSKTHRFSNYLCMDLYKMSPNYSLYTEITRIITRKWPNFIRYSSECYSIFASRSNTLTLNHHFCDQSTIQLRLQRFVIRLKDESRIGTLIHKCLIPWDQFHKRFNAGVKTVLAVLKTTLFW